MEPKALANVNGTLLSASATTPAISPTREFLNLSAATSAISDRSIGRRDTLVFGSPTPLGAANDIDVDVDANGGVEADADAVEIPLPQTPAGLAGAWAYNDDGMSPTTPYFLAKGAHLVQATCPPKQQTGQRLFPLNGRIEDHPDGEVRRRLILARRKSLQWAPRIGSPLSRG